LVALPSSESVVEVLFRPVLAGQGQATLRLSSTELGDYPYALHYEAKPAGLERTMVFKAPLGSTDHVQTIKFLHYAKKAASFTSKIEAAPGHRTPAQAFVVESKDIKAPAAPDDGVEVAVDVRFAPSSLGEIRSMLVLSSPDGGDYKALLVGHSQEPRPQGPIIIPNGKPGSADFYNPFDEAVEFTVQVDNAAFTIAAKTIKLNPRSNSAIAVQFKSDRAQAARLIVSTPKVSTPWIFFLKGTV